MGCGVRVLEPTRRPSPSTFTTSATAQPHSPAPVPTDHPGQVRHHMHVLTCMLVCSHPGPPSHHTPVACCSLHMCMPDANGVSCHCRSAGWSAHSSLMDLLAWAQPMQHRHAVPSTPQHTSRLPSTQHACCQSMPDRHQNTAIVTFPPYASLPSHAV